MTCEICGAPTRKRRKIGDVMACALCYAAGRRFDRMNHPKVTAEILEDMLKDARVVSVHLDQRQAGPLVGDWECSLLTVAGDAGHSIQAHPFQALADAFGRLPRRERS